ncbi:hypothetical protein SAMN02800694_1149 [Luteibacter sp. UNCMF331Sha3.1]|uniref:hypothetical protein n=1 Tax=Luteibacter sp. UNCMF331Sha3.1 TaxID=1502760 RepID=UPI0008B4E396|nr:hypothetical protein [Luteibacter sp. UNCMF331Sha3.1]SEM45704.1 hypothetical protein SAMN02800694_1149 [Luteibacter sp. UNCMF331Sha3.1]
MASIYTGLAFMHGHIVDTQLVLRLGRDDDARTPAVGSPKAEPSRAPTHDGVLSAPLPLRPDCAAC